MDNNKQLKVIYEIIGELLGDNYNNNQEKEWNNRKKETYNHQITSGVTSEMFKKIEEYCLKNGICKAELIRRAIATYLNTVNEPILNEDYLDCLRAANVDHA